MKTLILWLWCGVVLASPLDETRYCTDSPIRDLNGRIVRSSEVVRAFRAVHPCPVTNQTKGACPGWNIDHVIPLAVGGCDAVANLQWLPVEIKRCPGLICKDRWEREVYKRGG